MSHPWIADRALEFDSSGIRKVMDLARAMKNPINLSIGQPDFDVPEPIKEAAIAAIRSGKNGYAPTQGMAVLRDKLQAAIDGQYGHADRQVFVTSGTNGALVLAALTLVNPGDEVIVFDPYFVVYPSLVRMAGGVPVLVDTYPDFQVDVARVRAALTPRTKAIIFGSPANPTGAVASEATVRELGRLAAERQVALISDEIYSRFSFDGPAPSPAPFNPQTIVIDGFSKTYGMTGWRVGYAHGPAAVISQMIKLQQYTFVCAPQPAQWAAATALDVDVSRHIDDYRRKRDLVVAGLSREFQVVAPGGAFYVFPQAPWGSGSQFVEEAIRQEVLIIPGNVFSARDTHFRVSYAAADDVLRRGVDVLCRIAARGRGAY